MKQILTGILARSSDDLDAQPSWRSTDGVTLFIVIVPWVMAVTQCL